MGRDQAREERWDLLLTRLHGTSTSRPLTLSCDGENRALESPARPSQGQLPGEGPPQAPKALETPATFQADGDEGSLRSYDSRPREKRFSSLTIKKHSFMMTFHFPGSSHCHAEENGAHGRQQTGPPGPKCASVRHAAG